MYVLCRRFIGRWWVDRLRFTSFAIYRSASPRTCRWVRRSRCRKRELFVSLVVVFIIWLKFIRFVLFLLKRRRIKLSRLLFRLIVLYRRLALLCGKYRCGSRRVVFSHGRTLKCPRSSGLSCLRGWRFRLRVRLRSCRLRKTTSRILYRSIRSSVRLKITLIVVVKKNRKFNVKRR